MSKISLALPPEKVQKTLQNLLEVGCETRLGGLFLLIPFILQTKLERFSAMLWPVIKQKGVQPLQVLLLLIFSALGGLKSINKLSCYQDVGLAVLAGLPKLPSPTLMHQFLDRIKAGQLLKTKLSFARVLRKIGMIPGITEPRISPSGAGAALMPRIRKR